MINISEILTAHAAWLRGDGGSRANLRGADLTRANLRLANLTRADLTRANLRGANLSGANISGANLTRARIADADLSAANISGAELSGADLSDADLRLANLSDADLTGADLTRANISDANLRLADLTRADLTRADLTRANLRLADLSDANLSGVKGYLCPSTWVESQDVDPDGRGLVVYKQFDLHYPPPAHWRIEPGAVLTEVCNPDRGTECGSGINVAHRDWNGFSGAGETWSLLIEWRDLCTLVVPFGSDGKARVGRATILGRV